MAKTDEKVMQMVEQELARNPDASVDELYDKAKALNSGVARMTRRQFHARYPLQVKRRKGGAKRRKAGKAAKARKAAKAGKAAKARKGSRRGRGAKAAPGARKARKGGRKAPAAKRRRGRGRAADDEGRDGVRRVFLRFAQDVAGADTPAALVKLILSVDRYVDEAIKAR